MRSRWSMPHVTLLPWEDVFRGPRLFDGPVWVVARPRLPSPVTIDLARSCTEVLPTVALTWTKYAYPAPHGETQFVGVYCTREDEGRVTGMLAAFAFAMRLCDFIDRRVFCMTRTLTPLPGRVSDLGILREPGPLDRHKERP